MTRYVLAIAAFFAGAALVYGDGGTLVLHQRSGPLIISVFASPSPLRVGAADLSVLIQDAETDDVLLDGAIELELSKAGEQDIRENATAGRASNKLLYAATLDIPQAGAWTLAARCRIRGREISARGTVNVAASEPAMLHYWLYFALVPMAIGLFTLNQHLKSKRRGARLPIPP